MGLTGAARRARRLGGLCAAAALLVAAGPRAAERAAPSGTVVCAGADTMRGVVDAWARLLRARAPGVQVRQDVSGKLAADGFAALLAGQANCASFVREPFPAELAAFRARFGHDPLLVNVAGGSYATKGGTHALAIYVNAANPVRRIDLTQLDAVYAAAPRRGGAPVARWGELGAGGAWAARPVHAYGMLHQRESGNPPGIVNYVVQRVLLGGRLRQDVREQADGPGESALQAIVNRVAEDPDGIGYSGFGFARPGVRALAVAETPAGPFVAGTPQTVRTARYPLSRRIYVLVDRAPGAPLDPAVRAFLAAALSREGQAAVAADREGFLPLTPQALRAARGALE